MRKSGLFALVAALGLLLGIGATPAAASVDDFSFDSFHADYTLGRDAEGRSTLRTVEHFVVRFPDFDQNRGFIRSIPRIFDGHRLEITDISVTDENGEPRPFWQEASRDFLDIVMAVPEGSYVRGVQQYLLSFTQRDVTAFYEDVNADEFYWDLNGTDTRQPFGSVSATLALEPGLEEALNGDMACYRGVFSSTADCPIARDGNVFTVREEGLRPRENVSIAVGFEPGTFAAAPESSIIEKPGDGGEHSDPEYTPRASGDLFGLHQTGRTMFGGFPGLLVAGGASLAGAIALIVGGRRNARRNARTGRAIIAQYEPPPGVSVAVASDIMKAETKAMTASLLDFAVRRKIRLLHHLPTDVYGAQAIDDTGLLPDELKLYDSVFTRGTGGSLWFDRKSTRLGDAAALLATRSRRNAEHAGYYGKVDSGRQTLIVVASLGAIALLFAHALFNWGFGGLLLAAVIGFVGFVTLVNGSETLFAGRRPLTPAGGALREHLLGLREYIRLAEADRIRVLQSASGAQVDEQFIVQVYERLLPYAVLFGYEREWQSELSRYYRESTPDWVAGDGPFTTALQLSALRSAIASSPTTPVATSSGTNSGGSGFSGFGSGGSFSSSSGGSSGGGFSGGGGGGGGTRGI